MPCRIRSADLMYPSIGGAQEQAASLSASSLGPQLVMNAFARLEKRPLLMPHVASIWLLDPPVHAPVAKL